MGKKKQKSLGFKVDLSVEGSLKRVLSRVELEAAELKDRLDKLCAFMDTEGFLELNFTHQELLKAQGCAMSTYLSILCSREFLLNSEVRNEIECKELRS